MWSHDLGDMDMVIISEGFGIIPISMIFGTMIEAKEFGESWLSKRLVGLLRCICHMSLPDLGWMAILNGPPDKHVSLLLLVAFSGYKSNYELEGIFLHQLDLVLIK